MEHKSDPIVQQVVKSRHRYNTWIMMMKRLGREHYFLMLLVTQVSLI